MFIQEFITAIWSFGFFYFLGFVFILAYLGLRFLIIFSISVVEL